MLLFSQDWNYVLTSDVLKATSLLWQKMTIIHYYPNYTNLSTFDTPE